MENKYQDQPAAQKDSNKIYFLIVVIVALLGTNAFLFYREKKSNDKVVTVTANLRDEKSRMATEIDKIEAELDNANKSNVKLTADMRNEQGLARQKIASLRVQLKKGELTQGQLQKAQEDVKQLRYFVGEYTKNIDELRKQNSMLTVERDSLKSTVNTVNAQASELAKQNEELNLKVKEAASIKVRNIGVFPIRVKGNGKESQVSKAKDTKKLRIRFNLAENNLAAKGMHDVFIRIVDPSGNLIISDGSGMFPSDGEEMQYTYRTAIDFGNDNKDYDVDWSNPAAFQKGNYTIMLYADGYTMGKSAIVLK